ncbi:hypothetical protein HMPREF1544_00524 [Mucor circinelloides 1006PhL]|uniref:TPR-like protein n=1 Tax=Mucor circinelloides f. circinelloides (strain 1006PhL) TaxID=1220926 RepID=S2JQC9_MUCC1|nr:hypothetical protein HMPREF1544_00524 [Mucor circinelloides 1006PhL]
MASAKAIQISKDIDVARCNGNWAVIPELARRYKKYYSEGTVLEQTVLAEINLVQTINNTRSNSTTNYRMDDPYHISMEDRLDPNLVKPIQSQLLAAIQAADPNNVNATQKEFAKIVLARSHFECGEYDKAISIIAQLQFEKEHVSQGYGLVLFLQARAIKAISYELTGNEEVAVQTYQGVEALISENASAKNKSLIEWSEESLYRATLLGLKKESLVSTSSLLEFMRQYQKITTVQPTVWRIQKRMTITRHSLQYVSLIYRQGNYCLPAMNVPTTTEDGEVDPHLHRQMFIIEQSQLHTIYEKMLYLDVPLPRAGQVNQRVLDFVNQFANDFELMGTSAHDLRGFVEALDRASQRTFNSPLITRHLFHALVRLGEFEEAEHALHAYLYLVGLVSHGWKETHRDGQALATDKTGLNMPVPLARPDISTDELEQTLPERRESIVGDISTIKSNEKEEIADTLHVLVDAIRMYSNDLCRGVDAVEMAEIAKELLQKQTRKERMSSLLDIGAEVYRAVGVAYGLLGYQTFDPELRPSYHEKALHYLKYSAELNGNSWEIYYQIALQQADMHDIRQAVQSITIAIQRNPTHITLWHLLTLLISCPAQGDYRQALKTCEMGLQQAPESLDDDYIDAEQHMMYQMTRTLLLQALHGPESALESSETLFASYRKIAMPEISVSTTSDSGYGGAHNGMIISGSLGNLSELQTARRGRSASSSMAHHPSSVDIVTSTSTGHLGSRSHDNVHTTGSDTRSLTAGRARSASNLAANPSPLGPGATGNQLLTVPDEEGKPQLQQQQQHHHYHHPHIHGLHIFGHRGASSRSKLPHDNSIYSTASAPLTSRGNFSNQSLPTSPYDVKSIAGNSVASLQSLSPSVLSIQSILQPSNIPSKPSTRTVLRKERSDRILSDLWLLTAHVFIKLGKLDEARKAVEEAENVDWISNPQVWCALGQLLQAEGDPEQAQAAFQKALVIDPHDVNCRLWLAKSHVAQQSQEMAEGILDIMTKSNGWDCAEAWFHLGEIYKNTDRLDRTKACLFYALELESTTPIQPFSVLTRFI